MDSVDHGGSSVAVVMMEVVLAAAATGLETCSRIWRRMGGGLVGACGFARAGREEREIAGRETTGDGTVPIEFHLLARVPLKLTD